MGLSVFTLMWTMHKYVPGLPGMPVAVVLTTVVSWVISQVRGEVVGTIPGGLPSFTMLTLGNETFGHQLPA